MPHIAKRYLRTAKMKPSAGSTSAAPPANFSGKGETSRLCNRNAVSVRCEHCRSGNAGGRQRQHHLEERLHAVAAKGQRGFLKLVGDAGKQRIGDEHRKRQRQRGMHEGQPDHRIVKADPDEQHRQRQRQQGQRKRPRHHHHEAERLLARKIEPRQRIARRRPGPDRHHHRQHRHLHRVPERRGDAPEAEEEADRGEVERGPEAFREPGHFGGGRKRVDQEQVDRQQHPDAHQHHGGDENPVARAANGGFAHGRASLGTCSSRRISTVKPTEMPRITIA